jgi:hypothetical protein
MPILATGVTERSDQRSAAIEADAMRILPDSMLARLGFDRAPDQRPGRDIACCRKFPAHGAMDSIGRRKGDRALAGGVGVIIGTPWKRPSTSNSKSIPSR